MALTIFFVVCFIDNAIFLNDFPRTYEELTYCEYTFDRYEKIYAYSTVPSDIHIFVEEEDYYIELGSPVKTEIDCEPIYNMKKGQKFRCYIYEDKIYKEYVMCEMYEREYSILTLEEHNAIHIRNSSSLQWVFGVMGGLFFLATIYFTVSLLQEKASLRETTPQKQVREITHQNQGNSTNELSNNGDCLVNEKKCDNEDDVFNNISSR